MNRGRSLPRREAASAQNRSASHASSNEHIFKALFSQRKSRLLVILRRSDKRRKHLLVAGAMLHGVQPVTQLGYAGRSAEQIEIVVAELVRRVFAAVREPIGDRLAVDAARQLREPINAPLDIDRSVEQRLIKGANPASVRPAGASVELSRRRKSGG